MEEGNAHRQPSRSKKMVPTAIKQEEDGYKYETYAEGGALNPRGIKKVKLCGASRLVQ